MNGAKSQRQSLAELIETAYTNPDTFALSVLQTIRENLREAIPVLLAAFDGTEAVPKTLVVELFRGPLKDSAPEFLLDYLDERCPDRFVHIAQILADLKYLPAQNQIISSLSSNSVSVVVAAIKALMTFATPQAFDALSRFLLQCNDEVKLMTAEKVLAPVATELSNTLLKNYENLNLERKAWILKYLAETAIVQAMPYFIASLEHDPLGLGLYGVKGLGAIGDSEAVAVLEKHLDHPEWFLRKRIVEALGQAKSANAVKVLVRALTDSAIQVRNGAVEALRKVGRLDIPLLVESLENGGRDLRMNLVRAIGHLHDKRFLEPMIKTLEDRSMLIFTIDALGDLGFAEAAPALERFLTDTEWFNRLNAIEALGKLPISNLAELAERLLEDENDMVRNSATRILAKTAKQREIAH